ncbi:response regulator [Sediminispirochaeta bajacaliforniensis]|uniref:response regulator n=1 Tax=Sediminispirochaeta bajacaliforniensis TaxID=148 RepID=UPI00037D6922|nr:response regulator [Sediminispirochaeta bajacaliforniensis]
MQLKSILIVDDSATSRMITKRCFMMAGFQDIIFHEAEDGLNAMTFLNDRLVDLIVTDLRMPKMDGKTFVRKLNMGERTASIPVIVLSSMGNEQMEKELGEDQVLAIIRKPLSPAKIAEVLEGE